MGQAEKSGHCGILLKRRTKASVCHFLPLPDTFDTTIHQRLWLTEMNHVIFFTHSILSQKQRKFSATFTKESSNQMSTRLQGCPSNVTAIFRKKGEFQKLWPKICKSLIFFKKSSFYVWDISKVRFHAENRQCYKMVIWLTPFRSTFHVVYGCPLNVLLFSYK